MAQVSVSPSAQAPSASPPPAGATRAEARPTLAAFASGRAEDRVADLLAFALATEAAETGPAAVERARRQAGALLADHAARMMHNRIEEIRREAVTEQLGRLRRPRGLPAMVFANLLALAIAGGLALLLWSQPALLAPLLARLGA